MASPHTSTASVLPSQTPARLELDHAIAVRVAGIYLLAGMVWIGLSDLGLAIAGALTPSGLLVSVAKGIGFVSFSSVLVFFLCRREYGRIKQATDLLRAVVEGTADAIFVKDAVGRYLLVNAAAARVLGRSASEVLGRNDRELLDAPEVEQLMATDQAVMNSQEAIMLEEKLTYEGVTRIYQSTKSPYFDHLGNVVGLIGIGRNVTEYKEVEVALRETDTRLREAQRIAKLGSWSWEPQSERVWWSDAEFELLGVDSSTAPPGLSTFLGLLHPDDRPIAIARVHEMLAGGNEFANDLRVLRADGSIMWIHSQARATRDADGRLIRVEGTDQDITEQKRIESELERSAALLRSVLDSVGDAIVTIDTRGNVTSANRATERMFGYATHELLGLNARLLLAEAHRPQHDNYLDDYLPTEVSRGGGVSREVECLRKAGTTFPAEWTITEFMRDGQREFTGVLRDITERRQLEDKFRQSHKMEAVGRLAGGVAHDFNNLLTVINGYSELVLAELLVDDPARGPLTAIHDAGERAARLTEQLLAFSRKSMLEPQLVDLNELVVESSRLFRRLIGEDIVLQVVKDPAPVMVMLDPGQLEQLLMNLAVNARDAMPTGGQLTIETKSVQLGAGRERDFAELPPGHYAMLRVTDTGSGMSSDVRSKIFEPFFTTKEIGKGTGLGLAVVHGIVQQSGGSVAVETSPGSGTSFRILLPAVSDASSELTMKEAAVAPRGDETVLVVEDEDAVRRLVQVALEGQGYTVLTASDGSAARQQLLAHSAKKVDLLITDVIMPNLSGRELAIQLRTIQPELRILYMSGYTDDALDRHGLRGTSDQFIQKPFTPLGLARRVREILDQSLQIK